ncbi:MAG: carbohydrate kinase family protein, partial [Oscillospiraceae bacterium]
TSNCYLLLDENKNHITIFYPGAQDDKYSKPLDENLFKNSKFAVLTVGGYKDNVEFVDNCKKTSTPLIFGMKSDFTAFPIEFLKEILLYSEIIFTNEVECEEIVKLYNLNSITDLFKMGNA